MDDFTSSATTTTTTTITALPTPPPHLTSPPPITLTTSPTTLHPFSPTNILSSPLSPASLTVTSPTTASGPSFPFALLPPEIRLKVWDLLIHTPRVVEILCTTYDWQDERRSFRRTRSTRPPAVLAVNRESRALALAAYQPSAQLAFIAPRATPIYLHAAIDVVSLKLGDAIYLPYPVSEGEGERIREYEDTMLPNYQRRELVVFNFVRLLQRTGAGAPADGKSLSGTPKQQQPQRIRRLALERKFWARGWDDTAFQVLQVGGVEELLFVLRPIMRRRTLPAVAFEELSADDECHCLRQCVRDWYSRLPAFQAQHGGGGSVDGTTTGENGGRDTTMRIKAVREVYGDLTLASDRRRGGGGEGSEGEFRIVPEQQRCWCLNPGQKLLCGVLVESEEMHDRSGKSLWFFQKIVFDPRRLFIGLEGYYYDAGALARNYYCQKDNRVRLPPAVEQTYEDRYKWKLAPTCRPLERLVRRQRTAYLDQHI